MASSIRYFDSSTPQTKYSIFKSLFDKVESRQLVEDIEARKLNALSEKAAVTQTSKHDEGQGHMQTPEERAMARQKQMESARNECEASLRSWQKGVTKCENLPTTLKGVTVTGLRRMAERVKTLCQEGFFSEDRAFTDGTVCYGTRDYEALTTTQVVYQFVRDEDVSGSLRLADCASIVDPADLGRPSFFISHAWKGTFAHLLRQVFRYCEENNIEETVRFWLDVLAVNQHGGKDCSPLSQAQNTADVSSFQNVLSLCERGTVVVLQLDKVNTANRAWCLFEWSWTLHYHGNKGLKFLGIESLNEAKKMLNGIYVEFADCYDPRDKEMILADVRAHHGDLPQFDDMLKEKLRAIFINQFHQLPPSKETQQAESDEPVAAIQFDDGDFDANVPVSALVYRKLGDAADKLSSDIKRGDTVWAPYRNYMKPESIFPGKVIAIRDRAGGQGGPGSKEDAKAEEILLFIMFDDGDRDEVPLSQVFPGPGNPLFGESEYEPQQLSAPGSIVLATYRGGQRLYRGKVAENPRPVEVVAAAEEGGELGEEESSQPALPETYVMVSYDDGDFDPRVPASTIKPPTEEMLQEVQAGNEQVGRRVLAPWKGGQKLWSGRILEVSQANEYIEGKINSLAAARIAKIEEDARSQVERVKSQVTVAFGVPSGAIVKVNFDDGDVDEAVPLSRCTQEGPGAQNLPVDESSELVGTRVMAPYKGSQRLFPGVIAELVEESAEQKALGKLTAMFSLAKSLMAA